VKRAGKDLTIVTLGPALYTALQRPRSCSRSFGLAAEVDRSARRQSAELRRRWWRASVRKTGKVLLACDAVERGCVMQTVAATLTQLCFDDLDGRRWWSARATGSRPPPSWKPLFFPQPGWLLDAIHERIKTTVQVPIRRWANSPAARGWGCNHPGHSRSWPLSPAHSSRETRRPRGETAPRPKSVPCRSGPSMPATSGAKPMTIFSGMMLATSSI
jgi:hypothetical protein